MELTVLVLGGGRTGLGTGRSNNNTKKMDRAITASSTSAPMMATAVSYAGELYAIHEVMAVADATAGITDDTTSRRWTAGTAAAGLTRTLPSPPRTLVFNVCINRHDRTERQ